MSLGFIQKRNEFRRAVAAGSYHCFFNLFSVIIVFPLEYYFAFLSSKSLRMANRFFNTSTGEMVYNVKEPWSGFSPIVNFLTENISGGILLISSFALLVISILFFRRQITGLLKARSPETFSSESIAFPGLKSSFYIALGDMKYA